MQHREKRSCALVPKGGGGKHSALDAMRLIGAQYRERRRAHVPALFKVDGKRVKKILDFGGGVEFIEDSELIS